MQFRSPKRERRNDGISVGRFGFVLYAGKRQGCADKGGREVGMEYSVLMSVYAALVDLERSYTDYLVAQQAMNIDVYTRSIR